MSTTSKSHRTTPPVGRTKRKSFLQRYARRILGGSGGKLSLLFQRASERVGVPWQGGKAHGYELLELLYHQCKGVPGAAAPRPKKVKPSYESSDEFLQSYAWRRLRMEVLIEQGRRCACCGATPTDGAVMHVDHIKPRRLFPELALEKSNLQVLCGECNHGKGNWDQTDWRREPARLPDEAYAPIWNKQPN